MRIMGYIKLLATVYCLGNMDVQAKVMTKQWNERYSIGYVHVTSFDVCDVKIVLFVPGMIQDVMSLWSQLMVIPIKLPQYALNVCSLNVYYQKTKKKCKSCWFDSLLIISLVLELSLPYTQKYLSARIFYIFATWGTLLCCGHFEKRDLKSHPPGYQHLFHYFLVEFSFVMHDKVIWSK